MHQHPREAAARHARVTALAASARARSGPRLKGDGAALMTAPPKSSSSARTVATRKVDEILKRMLPHSIVQSYEKIGAALNTQAVVMVNGSPLAAVEHGQGTMRDRWSAQKQGAIVSEELLKPSHSLHYARSTPFLSPQPGLTLHETFKTLEVTVTSLSTGSVSQWFHNPSSVLTRKSWDLVSEIDPKIGLALYAISLGPWGSSSLVALVWVKGLEVVNLYLQLHLAELLYSCPPRPIRIPIDDIDGKHGLHSYTAAVTIRDFQHVVWESEFFSLEFSLPDGLDDYVRVGLLDEQNGYQDRSRFISSPIAAAITTDAVSVNTESAIVVDFTLWEASCHPIWGFSRLLPIATRDSRHCSMDISMSVAGASREVSEANHRDAQRDNTLSIQFESISATSSTKQRRTFVKQITIKLSTSFINKTFGTNYATQVGK